MNNTSFKSQRAKLNLVGLVYYTKKVDDCPRNNAKVILTSYVL